jgi:hypothetical protein
LIALTLSGVFVRVALMIRRFAAFSLLVVLAAGLGACSKCGWIWDDWQSSSCHGGPPRH